MIDFKQIFLVLALSFPLLGMSQAKVDEDIIDSKALYLKKAGKRSLKAGDYFGAIEYFKKYIEKKPEKYNVRLKLADSYRLARDYKKAKEQYLTVVQKAGDDYPIAYFYLAKMQMTAHEYDAAKEALGKFKKKYQEKDKSVYKKKMKLLLASCDFAPAELEKKANIKVEHLDTSINKAHIEASPMFLNDSVILYSSLRSDTIVYIDSRDSGKVYPVKQFYTAKIDSEGKWIFDKSYESPLNDANNHSGNACFNLDSSSIFFSRCYINSKGKMECSIFESKNEDGTWSEGKKLPETVNMPGFHATMPTIGVGPKYGNELLYFVSNRPRGKGGLDIWYSEYRAKRKQWKKAKNAGSKLNTVFDEVSPNYDRDSKTMHFSSEGWPGFGGLDVFSTTGELKNWEVPANKGVPINTSVDDLYYIENKDGDKGFVVSNREGGISLKNETCCDDIYKFEELKFVHLAIKGNVYDLFSDTNNRDSTVLLGGADLQLFLINDSTDEKLLIKEVKSGIDGDYFLKLKKDKKYLVVAKDPNTLAGTYPISTFNKVVSDTMEHDFKLKHINEKPLVIKNIYYEYDKSNLTDSSRTTIDTTLLEILVQNPSIIIEIGSHTDSRGSDSYNEKLSQERAQSVVDYLIEKGIDGNRLQAKGYGESQPIAPNEHPDGSDNPEGRQLNRRTEFKIVGKIKGVSEIFYER